MKINQNHSGSGDNIGRDKNLNLVLPTKWIMIILFGIFGIFTFKHFWHKIEISLGLDEIFHVDDLKFKILVLPFKVMCRDKPSKDIGLEIKDRLEELNKTDSLNIFPYYLEVEISKNFNSDSAEWLRSYHNADLIIYGNYYDNECTGGKGDEICYNWITDKKWGLTDLEKNDLTSSNYQLTTLDEIRKGRVQVKTDLIIYWITGVFEINQKKFLKALKRFDKIISLDPTDIEAYNTKGLILSGLGKYTESISEFDKSISYNPKNSDPYFNKGVSLCRLKKFENAIVQFDLALSFPHNDEYQTDCLIYKGMALYFLNRINESNSQFEKAVEINSDKLNVYNKIGIVFGNYEKYEEANKYFDKVINNASLDSLFLSGVCYNKGSTLIKLGDYERAIFLFNKAISFYSDDDESFYGKGYALLSQGKYKEAIAPFNKAININPNDFEYYFRKGVAFYFLEKYKLAIKQFDESIAINPDYAQSYFLKAEAMGKLKKYKEAINQFDKAISIDPNYYEAYFQKGIALGILGKYENSIIFFEKAIDIDSTQTDSYWGLANALMLLNKHEEALMWIETGLIIDPKDLDLIELKNSILDSK